MSSKRLAFDVLGVAAHQQAFGIEVRRAIELDDALGDLVGVALLFVGVLQKLLGHCLGVNATGHEVMALVAQDADNFGGQRFVEHAQRGLQIGLVALRDRAFFNVLAGAAANFLDVAQEWFFRIGCGCGSHCGLLNS